MGMDIVLVPRLNELIDAYNDYTAREFGSDPVTRKDIIDCSLGVCCTTCTVDENEKDERTIQINYNFSKQMYECYISDEYGEDCLVYKERTPIGQAIVDFNDCEFDDILHFFSAKIRHSADGYEHLVC